MLLKYCLILLSLSMILADSAHALNLQGYRFSDSYRYSLLNDSLHEKFEGQYVFTTSLGHVHSPFYFSDRNLNEVKQEIIKYNNILTAGFSYYLNKNVSLGIDLNAINNSVFGETYVSFADTTLKSSLNLRRTETFSLSLNPQIFIPTGNPDNFSTMGSISGSLSAVAEKSLGKLHLLLSLGALSSKNNVYSDVDHRQLVLAQLGVSYDVSERMNVNFEAFRNIPLVNDKLQDEGKYFVTAKHKTHQNFSTYFGAGVTGWDEVERNTYSFFAGLKFHEAAPVENSPVNVISAAPTRAPITREQERTLGPPARTEEIYFEHGQSVLAHSEIQKLEEYVNYFNEFQSRIRNVVIEGYASRVGSPLLNLKLSRQRASAVKNYFVEQGIPQEFLSVVGFGDQAEQNPDEGKNRKVQFRIHQFEGNLL